MYHRLTSAVKLSNGITPFFESFVGLRQGYNLSPMLFIIFINDFTEIFDEKCCPVMTGNYNLNCLLYADDLLLLSETENGLKECIARLGHYTKVWKLSVNLKKTKIMVFNKLGRIFDLRIPFEGKVIEPCSRYDYLGTTFTPSGSFSLGRKTVYKKASRAMFSFLSEINLRAGTQPSTIQKLFRALVRPILLYNCEVWGAFLKSKNNTSFEKFQAILFDDKLHHELLHNRLCKHLLGVHSKVSNFAVRGELGCYPINICLYTRLLKFFFHLIEISQGNPLIENSLKECNILLEGRKTSWLSTISHLLQLMD